MAWQPQMTPVSDALCGGQILNLLIHHFAPVNLPRAPWSAGTCCLPFKTKAIRFQSNLQPHIVQSAKTFTASHRARR